MYPIGMKMNKLEINIHFGYGVKMTWSKVRKFKTTTAASMGMEESRPEMNVLAIAATKAEITQFSTITNLNPKETSFS